MQLSELRQLEVIDLEEKLKTLGIEAYRLREKKALGRLSETHKIKEHRKLIARINTVIREKLGVKNG